MKPETVPLEDCSWNPWNTILDSEVKSFYQVFLSALMTPSLVIFLSVVIRTHIGSTTPYFWKKRATTKKNPQQNNKQTTRNKQDKRETGYRYVLEASFTPSISLASLWWLIKQQVPDF